MSRSSNSADKLVDLLFYVLPQYINEYNNQSYSKRHHRKKEGLSEEEKEEIYKKIKSLAFDNNHNVKAECKECSVRRGQGSREKHKSNIEKNMIRSDTEDTNNKSNKFNEVKGLNSSKLSSDERVSEKENSNKVTRGNCIYDDKLEFKKILKVLINRKVNIAISDLIRSIIYNVIILEVGRDIVKLKTDTNTIIVLCIKEIVAIQCDKKDYFNFVNNIFLNKNEDYSGELQKYLYSMIGKKVFIQTKGNGEFRYINYKKVTAVGGSFVIIEDSIIISIRKIILVEEVEC